MLTYKATYTLTYPDGKDTYTLTPCKSKEEAKKELFSELELLEKDGILENMTYCNILEEAEPKGHPLNDIEFQDILYHVFGHPYDEETGEVKEPKGFTLWGEPADKELQELNLKKINKKLVKLYKKRMKIDDKIEAIKDLIMPPKREKESPLIREFKGYLGCNIPRRKDMF